MCFICVCMLFLRFILQILYTSISVSVRHRLSQFRVRFSSSRLRHFSSVIVSVLFWLRLCFYFLVSISSMPSNRDRDKQTERQKPSMTILGLFFLSFTLPERSQIVSRKLTECLLNSTVLTTSFAAAKFSCVRILFVFWLQCARSANAVFSMLKICKNRNIYLSAWNKCNGILC